MKFTMNLLLTCLLVLSAATNHAQDELDSLKMAALEALITAPPERALPTVQRVLASDDSDEIKSRALFVLSQLDEPEALATLVDTAQNSSGVLQYEAIRMVGIRGAPEAMDSLAPIYANGNQQAREAVLQAYMISGDKRAVYEIASAATEPEDFERALQMLGAMGAMEEVRALGERSEMSEILVHAYAMTGDAESLRKMAENDSDPEARAFAIRALGMTPGPETNTTLMAIYRTGQSEDVRRAAREGLMIAGDDQSLLELFRESEDKDEKRELLRILVRMDSDAVWDEIDATLDDRQ